jgi:hypothetical protein
MLLYDNAEGSWDSSLGIATRLRIERSRNQTAFLAGARDFLSRHRPDRRLGPANLLTNVYRGLFSQK